MRRLNSADWVQANYKDLLDSWDKESDFDEYCIDQHRHYSESFNNREPEDC